MGVGKRALLEDYYVDELDVLFAQWSALHGADDDGEERVSGVDFLGGGGELL